jgi:hypothetical protein
LFQNAWGFWFKRNLCNFWWWKITDELKKSHEILKQNLKSSQFRAKQWRWQDFKRHFAILNQVMSTDLRSIWKNRLIVCVFRSSRSNNWVAKSIWKPKKINRKMIILKLCSQISTVIYFRKCAFTFISKMRRNERKLVQNRFLFNFFWQQ